MLLKQERQRAQLVENHKRQLAEDEKRMDEGLNWLKREQKKELDIKMLQHQQDIQNGTLDEESTKEWDTFMAQLQVGRSFISGIFVPIRMNGSAFYSCAIFLSVPS
jgi:hypothetical protein